MKLGFVSAILDGWTFEEMIDTASEMGYACVRPDRAFYLFVKTPEPDAVAFCERAKQYEIFVVPGDDFCAPGYVRVAYCVETAVIERALPAFRALAQSYGL